MSQINLADGSLLTRAKSVSLVTSAESFLDQEGKDLLEKVNSNFKYLYVEDSNPSISGFSNLIAYLPSKSLSAIVDVIKENEV